MDVAYFQDVARLLSERARGDVAYGLPLERLLYRQLLSALYYARARALLGIVDGE